MAWPRASSREWARAPAPAQVQALAFDAFGGESPFQRREVALDPAAKATRRAQQEHAILHARFPAHVSGPVGHNARARLAAAMAARVVPRIASVGIALSGSSPDLACFADVTVSPLDRPGRPEQCGPG